MRADVLLVYARWTRVRRRLVIVRARARKVSRWLHGVRRARYLVRPVMRGVRPSRVVVYGWGIRVRRLVRIVCRLAFGVHAGGGGVERGTRRVSRHRLGVNCGVDVVDPALTCVTWFEPLVRCSGLGVNGQAVCGCPIQQVVRRNARRVASGAQRVNSC